MWHRTVPCLTACPLHPSGSLMAATSRSAVDLALPKLLSAAGAGLQQCYNCGAYDDHQAEEWRPLGSRTCCAHQVCLERSACLSTNSPGPVKAGSWLRAQPYDYLCNPGTLCCRECIRLIKELDAPVEFIVFPTFAYGMLAHLCLLSLWQGIDGCQASLCISAAAHNVRFCHAQSTRFLLAHFHASFPRPKSGLHPGKNWFILACFSQAA